MSGMQPPEVTSAKRLVLHSMNPAAETISYHADVSPE